MNVKTRLLCLIHFVFQAQDSSRRMRRARTAGTTPATPTATATTTRAEQQLAHDRHHRRLDTHQRSEKSDYSAAPSLRRRRRRAADHEW